MGGSVTSLIAAWLPHGLAQGVAIVLGTFVLEDAATVMAAMAVASGSVPLPIALGALYAGVVVGDLGLYGAGYLSRHVRWIARLLPPTRTDAARAWLDGRVFPVVLASRFLPGARLPTYTAMGFLRADFVAFALAAVVATLAWTSLLFGVSLHVGQALLDYLGAWRWVGAAGFAITLVVIGRIAARRMPAR